MNCNGIFGGNSNEALWIVIIAAIVIIWLGCCND
jgi:hypothetical protein